MFNCELIFASALFNIKKLTNYKFMFNIENINLFMLLYVHYYHQKSDTQYINLNYKLVGYLLFLIN